MQIDTIPEFTYTLYLKKISKNPSNLDPWARRSIMKVVKWISIILGCLIVLFVLAIILIPMFYPVQKYKPEIEKKVAEATGRPFTLGGDLDISIFPWVGVSLSDLHLGNPPGFKEKDFVNVEAFEVRVKVLPLLSRKIEVKRFIMKRPQITLVKRKDGVGNWQGLGKSSKDKESLKTKKVGKEPAEKSRAEESPIKGLIIGEFAITDGRVLYIDQANNTQKEVSDFNLHLDDVSPDRPIKLNLSAKLDNQPIEIQGRVGPTGLDPAKGTIPIDLAIKAFDEINLQLKGKVKDAASARQFDFALQISPFSPKKTMKALGQEFPVKTSDPKVLEKVALKANLKGNDKHVAISNGLLELDQSKIDFALKAKEFEKPNLTFNLNLDKIDLDRYLPPPSKEKMAEKEDKDQVKKVKKKTDYTPLRKLVVNGEIKIGQLKAKGAKVNDIYMKIAGQGGLIHLDPLKMNLYQGTLSSTGLLDVRQDEPKTSINLQANGIQADPLVNDLLKKDIIEGTLESKIALKIKGDDADTIKPSLNGNGSLIFRDGAIKGIDLAGMVRNVKATFGLAEKPKERPKTDFAEFSIPFTMTNGVFNTKDTNLISPLLRIKADGKANLVSEALDFRVEPKFVATLKGQGDEAARRGVTVPVLVSGTFQAPKFRPDLEGMIKGTLSSPSKLKDAILGPSKEGESSGTEDTMKGILKKLPLDK